MRHFDRLQVQLNVVVRTCIGCRERVDSTDLVRLVVVREQSTAVVTLDWRRALPGRGAHLHLTPKCLAQAESRKAFGRALRETGALDLRLVKQAVAMGGQNGPELPGA